MVSGGESFVCGAVDGRCGDLRGDGVSRSGDEPARSAHGFSPSVFSLFSEFASQRRESHQRRYSYSYRQLLLYSPRHSFGHDSPLRGAMRASGGFHGRYFGFRDILFLCYGLGHRRRRRGDNRANRSVRSQGQRRNRRKRCMTNLSNPIVKYRVVFDIDPFASALAGPQWQLLIEVAPAQPGRGGMSGPPRKSRQNADRTQ